MPCFTIDKSLDLKACAFWEQVHTAEVQGISRTLAEFLKGHRQRRDANGEFLLHFGFATRWIGLTKRDLRAAIAGGSPTP